MLTAPVVRAMAFLVIAMLLVPLMDAFGKILATDHGMAPASVALGRFAIQTVIILATMLTLRRHVPLRPAVVWVHLVRGALHGASSLFFFVAIKYMPLADAIAVFFVEPMILIGLSALVLREHVGWPRRIAAIVGFGGALLVIQPSYELFGAVSLLPLATALLFASYLLFTRKYGLEDHPLTMQLWSGVGASLTAVIFIAVGELVGAGDYQVTLPTSRTMLLLFGGLGLVSVVAHLMIVMAYKLAEASVLAPFNYLEIVTATLFGFVIFDDLPGGLQWLGISIIVATGLFIFFRERFLEKAGLDLVVDDGERVNW